MYKKMKNANVHKNDEIILIAASWFLRKKIRTGRNLPKKKHKKLMLKYTETSFSEILGELLPVFTIEIPLRVEIYQNMSCKCPFYNLGFAAKQ